MMSQRMGSCDGTGVRVLNNHGKMGIYGCLRNFRHHFLSKYYVHKMHPFRNFCTGLVICSSSWVWGGDECPDINATIYSDVKHAPPPALLTERLSLAWKEEGRFGSDSLRLQMAS